jgi:hypothetical protein
VSTSIEELPALDELDGLDEALRTKPSQGKLYCVECCALRRMDLKTRNYSYKSGIGHPAITIPPTIADMVARGTSVIYTCVQCHTGYTAFLYDGPDGADIIVIPSKHGGIVTPRTPEGVRYYADQAHRAESIGARSAAVGMFRSALEHLLFQQGYTRGTCGTKIADLEKAIADEKAPGWALQIEPDLLRVLKELGDAALHPGDGDVKKQAALDAELLGRVKTAFELLLHEVYEEDFRRSELLDALRSARDKIPKK